MIALGAHDTLEWLWAREAEAVSYTPDRSLRSGPARAP
jgi:hypothetical protein